MDQKAINNEKIYLNKNLQVIFAVTLMAVLGVSSITPAFPEIERVLNISEKEVGLLITFFTLPGVFLTPVLGVLADRLGRKKILIPSLLLFGIAGSICFFIRDFTLLLTLRFVQGIGGASLGSLNVTLIGDLYSGKDRTNAMGYNASVLSIGTASYPAIGGALALAGWYFPFILPALAIPVALIVLFSLKNPEPKNPQTLKEYLGGAWKSIKRIEVFGIFTASVLTFILLYGAYLTFFPFLADKKFGASSLVIGILMSGMSFTTAITSAQLGNITKRFNERTLVKTSFLIYGIALLMIPIINNIWLLFLPIILFGFAQGINIPSIYTLLANMSPLKYRAAFMSLNGTVLRLGQTLGPLIMGLIFGIWGLKGVFYAGGIISFFAFLIILMMVRKKEQVPESN